jgi:hypothetical protein
MSHIIVRKLVDSRYQFAGENWFYRFNSELRAVDENLLKRYISSMQCAFARIAKSWNDDINTEWVCRIFFAAKMILAASVTLESLEYARKVNLKVCIPYLQYYSLLYSLRSLMVVLPNQEWKDGELLKQTHTKTINVICSEISKLDSKWISGQGAIPSVQKDIQELKDFREIISYRAPSSGGSIGKYDKDVLPLCKVPVEIAQMITEILEKSLQKYAPNGYIPKLISEKLSVVYSITIGGKKEKDDEDHYRIDYLARKYPLPTNILHIMSEGHVEDFFGSWCDEQERVDVFNPDENWGILFDVP